MPLQSLTLNNFRNFQDLKLDFHPEFNFIFGQNAQGKTNLIEAISYVSTLKSFRSSDKTDLIGPKPQAAQIAAHFVENEMSWDFGLSISPDRRVVTLNGKRPRSHEEYHQVMPIILFEPRHIYLFRASPTERRQYLVSAATLNDPKLIAVQTSYEKVVTQKNRILKDGHGFAMLDVWNEQLADLGAKIIFARWQWLNEIAPHLEAEYRAVGNAHERLNFDYKSSQNLVGAGDHADLTVEEIRARLAQKLCDRRGDEIERYEAFVGPHRDDFEAKLGERPIGSHGSQGENRSALIALKLAQLKLFVQKHGKTPLFLLDDVASELDDTRCRNLFRYLRDEHTQAFVTTTDNRWIGADFDGHSRSFLVEAGRVSMLTHA